MKAITRFLATIAMVAAVFTASPVMAQTLWKNAAYGMSVAEVQRAIPETVPTIQTEPPNSIRLGQRNAPELLNIDEVMVVGQPFHAKFFFLDGRLVQVILALKPAATAGYQIHADLALAMRGKYGKEISKHTYNINNPGTYGGDTTWMHGKTSIQVSYTGNYLANTSYVDVIYRCLGCMNPDSL